jgi:hypothetical protein
MMGEETGNLPRLEGYELHLMCVMGVSGSW